MDLYSLLGLNRSASAGDIERAYRRLARRYHPGVNPGDRVAEELYRQIQEAYDVLVDIDRRREYDRGARRPDRSWPRRAWRSKASIFRRRPKDPARRRSRSSSRTSFSTPRGKPRRRLAGTTSRSTRACHFSTRRAAPMCRSRSIGRIAVRRALATAVWRARRSRVRCAAEKASSDGRAATWCSRRRATCAAGRVGSCLNRAARAPASAPRSLTDVVTLTVPAGVERGARLAVPGRGHVGARGGPAGDLYVTVDVADHPFFRRDGLDLYLTLPVAVHEAALGARIDVPTLDGPATVRVPPGTQAGTRLRLRGRGIAPGRRTEPDHAGDLVRRDSHRAAGRDGRTLESIAARVRAIEQGRRASRPVRPYIGRTSPAKAGSSCPRNARAPGEGPT